MATDLAAAAAILGDPNSYANEHRLHEACAMLRRDSPVHWAEPEWAYPFWAITKHADVQEVERNHEIFRNSPRSVLTRKEMDDLREQQGEYIRSLVHMDNPDHKVYRAIGADWFNPRAMRKLQLRVDELAANYVDRMAELGGKCDFVADVAVHYPLYVILSLLGLPESDFPRMLQLTQELFGGADPDRRRGESQADLMAPLMDFFNYFNELTRARRQSPTDDLASAIANAAPGGEYLSDLDAASYYVIVATAGHDTTSSSIAGGLHALLTHPEQLAKLRAEPALLPTAVEEMIRWVTPVKSFMRTAVEDYSLRDVRIHAGESVLLSYPSANRDEDVFEDPFTFDIARNPNRHLAFGTGVHYCLGAALARMEARSLFAALLPRLRDIELAGEPRQVVTTFVGGLKYLPIRYQLNPSVFQRLAR
ncbi:cytochrome P450 [Tamaricihabitans halophyticus]|uniref:Cytochrome P450 n=1 Tax=Tamaricihabitans halophyticus TaxID=1262583 RepID=A0A4R2QV50_9PSEU|nr:cytochrome P450 [Tamaricihabitans halophyticus]TCP53154.1 cytochrome P450 [Tamaricihabitans halophyticus]